MKKCKFLCAMLLTLAFVGCSDGDIPERTTETEGVANAEKEALVRYSATYPNVINYKVARYLAYQELADGADRLVELPAEYELSELPNVIYNYDNLPKYYEYEVIGNGEVVATVTTYAQKEDDCVIAYILEGKRATEKTGKSAFVGEYPAVFYAVKQTPGTMTQRFTDAEGNAVSVSRATAYAPQDNDPWADYYAMTEGMDEENRRTTLATIEEMKQSPEYIEMMENEAYVNKFWAEIDNVSEDITAMSDKDINSSLFPNQYAGQISTKADKDPNGIPGSPSSSYIIPRYNNYNLIRTSWNTYCGPGAVAWIFRGLYDSYPISGPTKKYIPIHPLSDKYYIDANGKRRQYACRELYTGNSFYDCLDKMELKRMWDRDPNNVSRQMDNGFLEEIHSHTVKTGDEYPMYQLGITNAIKSITNGQYGVQSTTQSHNHIKKSQLPILICYVPKGSGGASHYMVGFGSGKIGTKKYVYVTDNANLIQDFGFLPYWRKETTGNYGLRYKIVKK